MATKQERPIAAEPPPDLARLLTELADPATKPERRLAIGDRLGFARAPVRLVYDPHNRVDYLGFRVLSPFPIH